MSNYCIGGMFQADIKHRSVFNFEVLFVINRKKDV